MKISVLFLSSIFLASPAFSQVATDANQGPLEHAISCPKTFAVPTLLAVAKGLCDSGQAVCGKPSFGRVRVDFKFDADGKLSAQGSVTGCRAVYKKKGGGVMLKTQDKQGASVFKYMTGQDGRIGLKRIKIRNDDGMNNGLKVNCKRNKNDPNCVGVAVEGSNVVKYGVSDKNHITMVSGAVGQESYQADSKKVVHEAPVPNEILQNEQGRAAAVATTTTTTTTTNPTTTAPVVTQETPAQKLAKLWKDPRYAKTYADFKAHDISCDGFKVSDLAGGAELAKEAGIDMAYAGKFAAACAPLIQQLVAAKCHDSAAQLKKFGYAFVKDWAAAIGKPSFIHGNKTHHTCGGRNAAMVKAVNCAKTCDGT
ncbi:MAG: hypothetical protein JNL01_09065 [Bdellovibrionales bacterium]|nr:hypothetical protein [Bdellovibrionales bacterium]